MFNGFTDIDPYNFFEPAINDSTRNSENKVIIKHHNTNRLKNVFSHRVAPHWNSLPNNYKSATNTNMFKNFLDDDRNLVYKFLDFD